MPRSSSVALSYLLLLAGLSSMTAKSAWPPGTVTQASSEALGNPPYPDSLAIDGNKSTFWNDATLSQFPDVLTIATPQPLNLSGIILLSNSGGWPTHYEVAGLSSNFSWIYLAELKDLPSYLSTATFINQIEPSQLRISVYNASTAPGMPLHTRINEMYPIYVNETTASASTSSVPTTNLSSSNSTSNQNSSAPAPPQKVNGAIIVGAVAGSCVFVTIISGIMFRIRCRSRRGQQQVWDCLSLHKKKRSRIPTKKDSIVQEMSNEMMTPKAIEMDPSGVLSRRIELGDSQTPGLELAGSSVLRMELSANPQETLERKGLGYVGKERRNSNTATPRTELPATCKAS